ncbi:MAG: NAD(P)/FAD-dependent oxidoreductase [Clostridia bacterium]|nr:NAD(P)/FAD-dependent oxidoreductase [Clostridia bacterium]
MAKKIIIIGGGVAGLSAGIYGALEGYDCTVLERHSSVGGNLTGWNRGGYHIDNCIHWLTGTAPGTELRQVWETLGALTPDTELCKTERFYGSAYDGQCVSMLPDLEATREEMLSLAPFDRANIDGFIDAVKLASDAQLQGRMNPKQAASFGMAMLKYGSTDLYGLSAKFRHPLLRRVMTDYIPGDYVSVGLIFAYAAYASGNGGIPKGGSAEMAKRMEDRFTSLSGKILTNAEVTGIKTENTRATGVFLRNGEFLGGDYIVCACDPEVTFGRLLGRRYCPPFLERCYQNGEKYPIFSSFHGAFAMDSLPVGFSATTVADVRPLKVGSECVSRMALREFSHEPGFAPKGKTVLQTMVFQRAADCEEWQKLREDRTSYDEKKKDLALELMCRAEESFPELKGRLKLLDAWTPATYSRYFGANKGAYMSFGVTSGARRKSVSPRVRGLENVLLATQWQKAPGGLPTAAVSGRLAAQTVSELEGRRKSYSRAAAM